MNNKIKMAVKIFLLVMMPTFYQNGVVVKINAMRGEKLQKVQYDPPSIQYKRVPCITNKKG